MEICIEDQCLRAFAIEYDNAIARHRKGPDRSNNLTGTITFASHELKESASAVE